MEAIRKLLVLSSVSLINLAKNLGERYIRVMKTINGRGRKQRGTKEPLMNMKEESEKLDLKLNIQKFKIMASGPVTSWQIDEETMETVKDSILGGLQNHCTR